MREDLVELALNVRRVFRGLDRAQLVVIADELDAELGRRARELAGELGLVELEVQLGAARKIPRAIYSADCGGPPGSPA